MRPAGEISQALLQAARELAQDGRGATLAELAAKACVSRHAARVQVSNIKRSGALQIVGERRVAYRNRPVAEYAPADDEIQVMSGAVVLGSYLQSWAR